MIIGLCGYARVGKDLAASFLVNRGDWERVSFADPLRALLLEIDPFTKHGMRISGLLRIYDWDWIKLNCPEVRSYMQMLGTGARDRFGYDCWVKIAKSTILNSQYDHQVLTDVRFKNEVDMIKELGGKIIWIDRDGVGPVNNHISEMLPFAEYCDAKVRNRGGSIEEYQSDLLQVVDHYLSTEVVDAQ